MAFHKLIHHDDTRENANGMEIQDILKDKASIKQWIEGFVDDTSLFTNTGFELNDIRILKEKLREDGAWWAGLLAATGGKLELSKCFYYILTWKFDKKGNPVAESIQEQDDRNVGIVLEDDNINLVQISQKDNSISHKTLGTMKNILGVENDHIINLKLKSNKYANQALNSQLNREQARLAYSYHYIPAMSYSLTAMCLNEAQIYQVQQKALREFIRIQGFDANFPRAVIFGPKKYGGVQLEQLYTYSYCTKIECLITNISMDTMLGGSMIKDLQLTNQQLRY